jgi:hypothetical protein
MDLSTKSIDEMMKGLPFYAQIEVRDFVTFLRAKHIRKQAKQLRQDWAGGLSQYRQEYTSLELQKKALQWRNT